MPDYVEPGTHDGWSYSLYNNTAWTRSSYFTTVSFFVHLWQCCGFMKLALGMLSTTCCWASFHLSNDSLVIGCCWCDQIKTDSFLCGFNSARLDCCLWFVCLVFFTCNYVLYVFDSCLFFNLSVSQVSLRGQYNLPRLNIQIAGGYLLKLKCVTTHSH